MAVPGLKGRLLLDTWRDITADLYARSPITHTRGRAYRKTAADPASCTAMIRNVDGRYTPRNPEGPYYGLLGRNTPFEITLPGGETYMSTTSATSSNVGARTVDDPSLDITGDIDVRIEATLTNWLASGSVELCGKGALTGSQRSWLLMMRDSKLHFEWSTAGVSTISVDSTVTLPAWRGRRMAVRVTLDVNNGASGNTATFYYADSIDGPWTQLGEPVVTAGTTSIFASTAVLTAGNGWPELAFPGPDGHIHAFQLRDGIDGTLVASPDFTAQTPGATSFTDSAGRPWTVSSLSSIDDTVVRFSGEVPEWPPKWSLSEADGWTPIQAAGILRRLSQGQKPLQSTLRRKVPTVRSLLAYWPMEEGDSATQASSPVPGVRPLKLSPANWAAVDSLPSSSPLPTIDSSGSTVCQLRGNVPRPASLPLTSWLVQYMYRLDTINSTVWTFLRIRSTGTITDWYVQMGSGIARIVGQDSEGSQVFSQDAAISSDLWGQWIAVQFSAVQSGSNVTWQIVWTDVGGDAGAASGSFSGSVGYPTQVASPPGGYASNLDGLALGHISVWSVWDTVTVSAYAGAVDAWAGEPAGVRMQRLCAEEGVPLTIVGDPADTERVGPQRPKKLLDLLLECAEADGGIFGEVRERRELVYRTRANLYNQAPKLTLDYASGHVVPPFEPVEDDQIRNDWTVTRDGGSSGYATLEEGELSVQDPPDGIGLYDDSTTLNLFSDDQTATAAGWLLHLSSWDEARYPSVTLRLHHTPELIPAVLALDVGDKIRIVGLPVRFASGNMVELLVDGWTETFKPRAWEITYNCSPAGPYTVGVTDDEVLGIVDSGSTELAAAAGAADTVLSVDVADGLLWVHEVDFDVKVGGEVMTVTGVTGAVEDSFQRLVTNGWGTADTGDTWTLTGGSTSDYSVQGA